MPPSSNKSLVNESALADKIVELRNRGILSAPFGVAEIRKHFSAAYEESHIRTVLPNYCERTGYWVKQGYSARFKRVARGKYDAIPN
jgi:hypothetical protein